MGKGKAKRGDEKVSSFKVGVIIGIGMGMGKGTKRNDLLNFHLKKNKKQKTKKQKDKKDKNKSFCFFLQQNIKVGF